MDSAGMYIFYLLFLIIIYSRRVYKSNVRACWLLNLYYQQQDIYVASRCFHFLFKT